MAKTVDHLGRLDILVNNAAQQHMRDRLAMVWPKQLQQVFATNIYSNFYLAKVRQPCGPLLRDVRRCGAPAISLDSPTDHRSASHCLFIS